MDKEEVQEEKSNDFTVEHHIDTPPTLGDDSDSVTSEGYCRTPSNSRSNSYNSDIPWY